MAERMVGQRNLNGKNSSAILDKRINKPLIMEVHKKKQIPVKSKHSLPKNMRRVQKTSKDLIDHVLDTNVLLSAWEALFEFDEHNIYIVSEVWRELDKYKNGFASINFNARKAIRVIDSLIAGKTAEQIKAGIPLVPPKGLGDGRKHTGRLFLDFSKPKLCPNLDVDINLNEPDDRILSICLTLKEQGRRVVLICKDANFRVRASYAGIDAEEYLSGVVADYSDSEENANPGFHKMSKDFWEENIDYEEKHDGNIKRYEFKSPFFKKVNLNEFLVLPDNLKLQVVGKLTEDSVTVETFVNYKKDKVYGIKPKNLEQELALQLLMDQRVSAVSLGGLAGSGKTLLALAAGLSQVYDKKLFRRIIMTRPTIPAGEGIGFLPGTEEEKMSAWMGALTDSLEILTEHDDSKRNKPGRREIDEEVWGKMATDQFLRKRIEIKAIDYMKGRTLINTYFIVDETQDLDVNQVKMLATRIGPGSKIVFLGNVAQIDSTSVTEYTSGLSVFIGTFRKSKHVGHITLQTGERHPFATEAEKLL